MQKIPTLFIRQYPQSGKPILMSAYNPEALWVPTGVGVPTRKMDGTAILIRGHDLLKRYDAKPGRTPPEGFEQIGEPDEVTGRVVGWVPVNFEDPNDQWIKEAWENRTSQGSPVRRRVTPSGTYELVGPKINGNPHRMSIHHLVEHRSLRIPTKVPVTFGELGEWLSSFDGEGIVWHHIDGRMAKIKRRDFDLPWPLPITLPGDETVEPTPSPVEV
jgi:hypothetical protein